MIAIASPNNPTGSVATREQLLQIANAAPDAAVLVDEAYYEFHGQTVIPEIEAAGNLFVARTFSKAYGLAGLRIGLICGSRAPMLALRRISSPYNVNAVALLVLPGALADREYVEAYAEHVKQGRERLARELRQLGIAYWPSQANFLLVNIGPLHREFVAAIRQCGILLRDRSGDPGCEGCVRITIGTPVQMDELIAALREVWAEMKLQALVTA